MNLKISAIVAGYFGAAVLLACAAGATWVSLLIIKDPSAFLVLPGTLTLWGFALWYLARAIRRHLDSI